MTQQTLVRANIPEIATKQLRFRSSTRGRVLTISSNLLTLFDFSKGDLVTERSLGQGKGMVIERVYDAAPTGRVKQVYARHYPRRKNNPLEHQIEVSSQKLINESFPADCSRVHISFEAGRVVVTPIRTVAERSQVNAHIADPDSVFAALTSGVDLASMRKEGFSISAVLEWRPQEARDKTDLTETGALTALANSGPLHALFNEDITLCALDRIATAMEAKPVMMLHASPQCDDHSNLKSKAQKLKDLDEGSSSADMILDLLSLIERLAPPVVVFENVPGMVTSASYEIACLRLKRWGYQRHEHIGDARDFGGMTSRKRAYVVFTQLDAPFAFEQPSTPRKKDAWSVVAPFLSECRDVSHSKSLKDGKVCGRLRSVRPGAQHLPTPIKSQGRMAKDSIVIEPKDDLFLFPSENLLKRFLGIEDVDLSAVSSTLATEIIGQSIDVPHHKAVMRAIRAHIDAWRATRANKQAGFSYA